MFSKVVLPEPERPMIATNSPLSTVNDTSCRAWMVWLPTSKVRLTLSTRTISGGAASAVIATVLVHVRTFGQHFHGALSEAQLGALRHIQALQILLRDLKTAGAVN